MHLATNRGQVFIAGSAGRNKVTLDVGSGFLALLSGGATQDVDFLSFIFLRPISRVDISNVRFQHLPPKSEIRNLLLDQKFIQNPGSVPLPWNFSGRVEVIDNTSWYSTASRTFIAYLTVGAVIPEIERISEGQYDWRVGNERNWSKETIDRILHNWDISDILSPGRKVSVTVTLQSGAMGYRLHIHCHHHRHQ